ncbi:MAG: CHAP domain-containing protein [Acidimicrobiales bacterium]
MLGKQVKVGALALVMMVGLLTACQPARVGAKCRTTDFGDDGGSWVLQCRGGRWQRMLTKQRVAELILTAQAQAAGVVAGSTAPSDDYPANLRTAARDAVTDPWGFPNRECTSFLAWRLSSRNGYSLPTYVGDATTWDDQLAPYAAVNGTPAVGAIAQWNANESYGGLGAGPLGHVAWVQAVYSDGSVMVEQYNLGNDGSYVQMHTRAPRYIHVRDL